MAYNQQVDRTGTSRTAREIPESVAAGILADAAQGSAALAMGNVFRMPAYQHRIRVLKTFADAFWLDGVSQAAKDSALKQTTKVEWDNVYVTPEEIAVLVPIADAWMDDSDIAWEEIRKEVARAFAKKIDQAIFFGAGGVPATFGNGIVPDAIAAGNYVTVGANIDLADDIAQLAYELETDGYDLDGFAAEKGFSWRLRRLRASASDNTPIFQTSFQGGNSNSLYGQTYQEVGNGAWDSDEAALVGGEWDKLRIGVRQDMTFDLFDQAIIQDDDGAIVYNSVQQDGKVLRAVMRLGYAVPNPVKVLGGTYPFAVLANDAPAS